VVVVEGLVVGGEVEVGAVVVTGAAVVGASVGAAWAMVVGGCTVAVGATVVTGAPVDVGAAVVVDTVELVVSEPLAATAVPRVVDPVEVRLPLLPQAAATNNRPAATNSTAVRRLIIGSLRPERCGRLAQLDAGRWLSSMRAAGSVRCGPLAR
jgi:hypothetical protein